MRNATKFLIVTLSICILFKGIILVQPMVREFVQYRHDKLICDNGDYIQELGEKKIQLEIQMNEAVGSGDVEQCDKMPYYFCHEMLRQKCYVRIAALTKDTSICRQKMEDRTDLDWCYREMAVHNKDVGFCDALGQVYEERGDKLGYHLWPAIQAQCYHQVVQVMKDASVCSRLSTEAAKTFCRLRYTDSDTQCLQMNDSYMRLMCESYLRAVLSNEK